MEETPQNRPPITCPATIVLVVINILVFLRTDFFTLMGWENTWMQKGAINWQYFFYDRQYYRLFTYMFLHVNAEHIFNNMVSLVFLGNCLEKFLGTPRFTALYFSSGILAGCTSLVYNMMSGSQSSSVGASGAVCGVLGALIILMIKHRFSDNINRPYLFIAVFLVLYSSFTVEGADNAAHIGGCIAGALAALLLSRHRENPVHDA
jgi:rhomboid protease GluP